MDIETKGELKKFFKADKIILEWKSHGRQFRQEF